MAFWRGVFFNSTLIGALFFVAYVPMLERAHADVQAGTCSQEKVKDAQGKDTEKFKWEGFACGESGHCHVAGGALTCQIDPATQAEQDALKAGASGQTPGTALKPSNPLPTTKPGTPLQQTESQNLTQTPELQGSSALGQTLANPQQTNPQTQGQTSILQNYYPGGINSIQSIQDLANLPGGADEAFSNALKQNPSSQPSFNSLPNFSNSSFLQSSLPDTSFDSNALPVQGLSSPATGFGSSLTNRDQEQVPLMQSSLYSILQESAGKVAQSAISGFEQTEQFFSDTLQKFTAGVENGALPPTQAEQALNDVLLRSQMQLEATPEKGPLSANDVQARLNLGISPQSVAADQAQRLSDQSAQYASDLRAQRADLYDKSYLGLGFSGDCLGVCQKVDVPILGGTETQPLNTYLRNTDGQLTSADENAKLNQNVSDFFRSGQATADQASAYLKGNFTSQLLARNISDYQQNTNALAGAQAIEPTLTPESQMQNLAQQYQERADFALQNINRLTSEGLNAQEQSVQRQLQTIGATPQELGREAAAQHFENLAPKTFTEALTPQGIAGSIANAWTQAYNQLVDPTTAMQLQRLTETPGETLNDQALSTLNAAGQTLAVLPLGKAAESLFGPGEQFAGSETKLLEGPKPTAAQVLDFQYNAERGVWELPTASETAAGRAEASLGEVGSPAQFAAGRQLVPFDESFAQAQTDRLQAAAPPAGSPLSSQQASLIDNYNQALQYGTGNEVAAARQDLQNAGLYDRPGGLTNLGNGDVVASYNPNGSYEITPAAKPLAETNGTLGPAALGEAPEPLGEAGGPLGESGAGEVRNAPSTQPIPPTRPGSSGAQTTLQESPRETLAATAFKEPDPFLPKWEMIGNKGALVPSGGEMPLAQSARELAVRNFNDALATVEAYKNFPGALRPEDFNGLMSARAAMATVSLEQNGQVIRDTDTGETFAELDPATGIYTRAAAGSPPRGNPPGSPALTGQPFVSPGSGSGAQGAFSQSGNANAGKNSGASPASSPARSVPNAIANAVSNFISSFANVPSALAGIAAFSGAAAPAAGAVHPVAVNNAAQEIVSQARAQIPTAQNEPTGTSHYPASEKQLTDQYIALVQKMAKDAGIDATVEKAPDCPQCTYGVQATINKKQIDTLVLHETSGREAGPLQKGQCSISDLDCMVKAAQVPRAQGYIGAQEYWTAANNTAHVVVFPLEYRYNHVSPEINQRGWGSERLALVGQPLNDTEKKMLEILTRAKLQLIPDMSVATHPSLVRPGQKDPREGVVQLEYLQTKPEFQNVAGIGTERVFTAAKSIPGVETADDAAALAESTPQTSAASAKISETVPVNGRVITQEKIIVPDGANLAAPDARVMVYLPGNDTAVASGFEGKAAQILTQIAGQNLAVIVPDLGSTPGGYSGALLLKNGKPGDDILTPAYKELKNRTGVDMSQKPMVAVGFSGGGVHLREFLQSKVATNQLNKPGAAIVILDGPFQPTVYANLAKQYSGASFISVSTVSGYTAQNQVLANALRTNTVPSLSGVSALQPGSRLIVKFPAGVLHNTLPQSSVLGKALSITDTVPAVASAPNTPGSPKTSSAPITLTEALVANGKIPSGWVQTGIEDLADGTKQYVFRAPPNVESNQEIVIQRSVTQKQLQLSTDKIYTLAELRELNANGTYPALDKFIRATGNSPDDRFLKGSALAITMRIIDEYSKLPGKNGQVPTINGIGRSAAVQIAIYRRLGKTPFMGSDHIKGLAVDFAVDEDLRTLVQQAGFSSPKDNHGEGPHIHVSMLRQPDKIEAAYLQAPSSEPKFARFSRDLETGQMTPLDNGQKFSLALSPEKTAQIKNSRLTKTPAAPSVAAQGTSLTLQGAAQSAQTPAPQKVATRISPELQTAIKTFGNRGLIDCSQGRCAVTISPDGNSAKIYSTGKNAFAVEIKPDPVRPGTFQLLDSNGLPLDSTQAALETESNPHIAASREHLATMVPTVDANGRKGFAFSDGREGRTTVSRVHPNVLQDSRFFSNPVQGTATYYIDNRTASQIPGGAQMNPELFASPYLPQGTLVEVESASGRKVAGVIGDFGPHPRLARVIDLSKQALTSLGMRDIGKVTVRVLGYFPKASVGLQAAHMINQGTPIQTAVANVGSQFTANPNYDFTNVRVALKSPQTPTLAKAPTQIQPSTLQPSAPAATSLDVDVAEPAPVQAPARPLPSALGTIVTVPTREIMQPAVPNPITTGIPESEPATLAREDVATRVISAFSPLFKLPMRPPKIDIPPANVELLNEAFNPLATDFYAPVPLPAVIPHPPVELLNEAFNPLVTDFYVAKPLPTNIPVTYPTLAIIVPPLPSEFQFPVPLPAILQPQQIPTPTKEAPALASAPTELEIDSTRVDEASNQLMKIDAEIATAQKNPEEKNMAALEAQQKSAVAELEEARAVLLKAQQEPEAPTGAAAENPVAQKPEENNQPKPDNVPENKPLAINDDGKASAPLTLKSFDPFNTPLLFFPGIIVVLPPRPVTVNAPAGVLPSSGTGAPKTGAEEPPSLEAESEPGDMLESVPETIPEIAPNTWPTNATQWALPGDFNALTDILQQRHDASAGGAQKAYAKAIEEIQNARDIMYNDRQNVARANTSIRRAKQYANDAIAAEARASAFAAETPVEIISSTQIPARSGGGSGGGNIVPPENSGVNPVGPQRPNASTPQKEPLWRTILVALGFGALLSSDTSQNQENAPATTQPTAQGTKLADQAQPPAQIQTSSQSSAPATPENISSTEASPHDTSSMVSQGSGNQNAAPSGTSPTQPQQQLCVDGSFDVVPCSNVTPGIAARPSLSGTGNGSALTPGTSAPGAGSSATGGNGATGGRTPNSSGSQPVTGLGGAGGSGTGAQTPSSRGSISSGNSASSFLSNLLQFIARILPLFLPQQPQQQNQQNTPASGGGSQSPTPTPSSSGGTPQTPPPSSGSSGSGNIICPTVPQRPQTGCSVDGWRPVSVNNCVVSWTCAATTTATSTGTFE